MRGLFLLPGVVFEFYPKVARWRSLVIVLILVFEGMLMKKLIMLFMLIFALAGCQPMFTESTEVMYTEQEKDALSVRHGVVQHVRSISLPARNDKNAREVDGLELTVQLENGQELVVAQEADDFFKKGDRVRIVINPNGTARVQNE